MKKVFFSLAVLATVALVSCGGKKEAEADTTAMDTEVVVAAETDTLVNDSTKDTAVVTEAVVAEEAPAAEKGE